MFLSLTVPSIFPADGVIRRQHRAFSRHMKVTAWTENELVEWHLWQQRTLFMATFIYSIVWRMADLFTKRLKAFTSNADESVECEGCV